MVSNSTVIDEVLHVRHFDDRHAVLLEECGEATREAGKVGNVRHHVVRVNHICAVASLAQRAGQRIPEEVDDGPNPALLRHLGDVRGGLDAEHGTPARW